MGICINEKNDLSDLIKVFLEEDVDCFQDYIGKDLSVGGRKKIEFYGVSKDKNEKLVHFITGRFKEDDKKDFFEFYKRGLSFKEIADYVYIFDIYTDNFEETNKFDIEYCKEEGIGILLLKDNRVYNFLTPEKNDIDNLKKKETIYRIFLNDLKKPIGKIIFQAFYECIVLSPGEGNCLHYIQIYNSLFSDSKYRDVLKKILPTHELSDVGMRKGFGNQFKDGEYVQIQKKDEPIWHYICMTDKGDKLGKEPILLDYPLNFKI